MSADCMMMRPLVGIGRLLMFNSVQWQRLQARIRLALFSQAWGAMGRLACWLCASVARLRWASLKLVA